MLDKYLKLYFQKRKINFDNIQDGHKIVNRAEK